HDPAKIDCSLWAALECDLHYAPLYGCSFIMGGDVVAAYHVHYNLGTLFAGRRFGGRYKVLSLIVNGNVRAESAAGLALFFRTGGRNHTRAQCPGKLNFGCGDNKRAAVGQESFGPFQTTPPEPVVPDREEKFPDLPPFPPPQIGN